MYICMDEEINFKTENDVVYISLRLESLKGYAAIMVTHNSLHEIELSDAQLVAA